MRNEKDKTKKEVAIVIDASVPVSKAIGMMKEKEVEDIIITENEEVLGLFSHLMFIGSRKDSANIPVGKYVLKIAKITEKNNYIEIAEQMINTEIRVMPILDKDGRIIRIIDIYEIIEQVINPNTTKQLEEGSAITIDYNDSLGEVMNLMREKNLREIPVLDNGEIVGFASSTKILETYSLHDTIDRNHGQIPNTPADTTQTELHDSKDAGIFNFIQGEVDLISSSSLGKIASELIERNNPLIAMAGPQNNILYYYASDILKQALNEVDKLPITFAGLDDVDISYTEKRRIDEITEHFVQKIQKQFNDEYKMIIHIKEHSKEGERSRYETICKITSSPGNIINSKSEEWDVIASLRNSLESIENQLNGK